MAENEINALSSAIETFGTSHSLSLSSDLPSVHPSVEAAIIKLVCVCVQQRRDRGFLVQQPRQMAIRGRPADGQLN